MDNWDELFKNSIEQDRGFQVDKERWLNLEKVLDQDKRRKGFIWWFSGLGATVLISIGLLWINRSAMQELDAFPIVLTGASSIQEEIKPVEKPKLANISSSERPLTKKPLEKKGSWKRIKKQVKQGAQVKIHSPIPSSTEHLEKAVAQQLEPELPAQSVAPTAFKSEKRQARNSRKSSTTGKSFLFGLEESRPSQNSGTSVEAVRIEPLDWLRRPRPTWTMQASLGGLNLNEYSIILPYSTAPQPGVNPVTFVRADGERLKLYSLDWIRLRSRTIIPRIHLGLIRQFRSGVNLIAGMSYSGGTYNNDRLVDRLEVNQNLFYFNTTRKLRDWDLRFGMQYTLMKRKRIQPYFGASLGKNFWSVSESETRAFRPSEDFEQLVNRTESQTAWKSGFWYFYLETGIQYRINEQFSVGLQSYLTQLQLTPTRVSFAVEGRYRLGQKAKERKEKEN